MAGQQPSEAPPPETQKAIDEAIPVILAEGSSAAPRLLLEKPARYSFLGASDQFHGWYQWRLEQFRSTQNGQSGNTKAPKVPQVLSFSVNQPSVSIRDYEVIKLAAFYAAQDDNFVDQLAALKPGAQAQFGFLKKDHSLHGLFRSLIEQYKLAASPTAAMKQRLATPHDLLGRAVGRAEYDAFQREQTRQQEDEAARERLEYAQVDWQDFVVVQTIDFGPGDLKAAMRKPLTREEVEFASLTRKGLLLASEKRDSAVADSVPPAAASTPPASLAATASPTPPPATTATTATTETATGPARARERTFKSPFTGEAIPESEYDEHVRIMNLDPRWRDQKRVEAERTAHSNLDTERAAANLKRVNDARAKEAKRRRP